MMRVASGCLMLAALAVSLAQPARADVAVVIASSGAPAARGAEPDATHLAMEDLGGAVPIAMRSERVEIDLYPTMVVVDAVFVMRAEQTVEQLIVAFPEQLEAMIEPGPGLFGLSVEVDGQLVTLEHGARRRGVCEKVFGHYWGSESWWAWPMRAEAGRNFEIHVRYAQLLDPFQVDQRVSYVLRTGASWLGPIGHGEIELRLHNVAREHVKVFWPELDPKREPPDPSTAPLDWSFDALEPDQDVGIVVEPHEFLNHPDLQNLEYPETAVHELLLRVSLLRWQPDPVREWKRILALMEEVEGQGDPGRHAVVQLRREIASAINERPDESAMIDGAEILASTHGEEVQQYDCTVPDGTCVDEHPSLDVAPLAVECLRSPVHGLLQPARPWYGGQEYIHDPLDGLAQALQSEDEPDQQPRPFQWWWLAGVPASLGLAAALFIWRRR